MFFRFLRRSRAKKALRWRSRWLLRIGGLILICSGVYVRILDPYPVIAARQIYFDYLQRLSPRLFEPDLPVRVVDIDETSLSILGQWPWPRTLVADMVDQLNAYGAASVGFDVLFAEPDRYSPARFAQDPSYAELFERTDQLSLLDNDVRLADANASLPVILGVALKPTTEESNIQAKAGIIQIGDNPSNGLNWVPAWTSLAPPLAETASGIGSINVSPGDTFGIIRTVPLLWQSPGGLMPSFSLEALRVAMQEPNILLEGAHEEEGIVRFIELGSLLIPTTEQGELWVRYRHDNPGLYISAVDVMTSSNDAWLRNEIEGKIVLVGTSAAGLLDIRQTPLGESVPGVSIHAQVIEQLLLGQSLHRSDTVAGLEILSYVALGLVVTTVMSLGGAVMSFAAGGVAAALVLLASWLGFQHGSILFDATFPLAGGMVNFAVLSAYLYGVAERDKRAIRRSLSHYVAPGVLEELDRTGQELRLGGETQNITVLFSDIRNFTPLSERISPIDLVDLLNKLFTCLAHEIQAEKGTVDKFIGDAVMAFWNAPLNIENHQLHAVRAALRLRSSLEEFNQASVMQGLPPIELAIGCASGLACVGNIGSESRFNYTAIGDVVNVASRIENICRHVEFDIVVSKSVMEAIGGEIGMLEAGIVKLKGKTEREPIYIVVGGSEIIKSDAFTKLKSLHHHLIKDLYDSNANSCLETQIQSCMTIARQVNPRLPDFYTKIIARREDFLQPAYNGLRTVTAKVSN